MAGGAAPFGWGARPRLAHNPALDGLRGLAVAGVLLFHAGHLRGGYLGVDLFFVLSGYLITTLLIVEWEASGTISLRSFWARRARRLLPALVAVLVAVSVAARWFVPPVARGQLRGEGIATLGYVANWHAIARGHGYWQQHALPSWLEHTWSLAIEEQFYLVWPLVVLATWGAWRRSAGPLGPDVVRRGVRRLAVLAWIGVVASAGLMVGLSLVGALPDRLYLGTDTRAAAILLGVGLACRQHRTGATTVVPERRWITGALGAAGAAVLAVVWSALDGTGDDLYRGGLLACGLLATLVLLDVTTAGSSPLQRLLGLRPLQWVGVVSYGLYLWHWPLFQYLHPGRFGMTGWTLTAVRIGASVAVAVASYRLLELPIRRGALHGRAARLTVPLTAAAAVLAVVLGTTGAVDPEPTLIATQAPTPADVSPPEASPPVVGSTGTARAAAPRVMVVGDSVASLLAADGISPLADDLGVQLLNSALVGCTILYDGADQAHAMRNCTGDWGAEAQRYRPDVVVVLFGVWMDRVPLELGGEQVRPCDTAWRENWLDRVHRAVTTLGQTGAQVVLVSAPTAPDAVWKGEDPHRFDASQACSNDVLERIALDRPEAHFVDLARFVCPSDDRCRTELDGVPLRYDALHYVGDGARVVARWLVPEVLDAMR